MEPDEIERNEFDERDLSRIRDGLEWLNAFYTRNGRSMDLALGNLVEVLKWRKEFSANGKKKALCTCSNRIFK
jgi:hypothetical protein